MQDVTGGSQATICGLPTSHVHGAITAIPLVFLPLALPPRVLHASRRVGGGCGGRENERHGRKTGVVDWCRGSALILRAVNGAEELDWPSGVVIRLQRIYNFCLFHAIILSTLDVLYAFMCYFI